MKPFQNLKILIIAPAYAASPNRRWIKEIAARYGVNVTLLTARSFKEGGGLNCCFQREDGETYTVVIGRAAFCNRYTLTFFYTKIYGVIKNLKPDIIEINAEPRSLLSLQTILLRNIFSPRTKVSFYSLENIVNNTYLWFRIIKKIVFKYAQGANVCNRETVEVLRREGFKGKIDVIPLAIDTERFCPKDSSLLRKKLGLTGLTIGYLGRISRSKGIITLLNAFKNITLQNINLLVVGDGPDSHLLDKYRTMRGTVFVRGLRPQDVADYLNCMDILVCPSVTVRRWKEQFGRAIVEAMACGLAVIGSDSGAIPEILGDAGLIFNERDVTGLTRKLITLIENETLRRELGKKARERVIANYAPVKISEKYMKFYQKFYPDEA
jgi:glycosyltransferase involved in cell wall biosynthesis